MQTLDYEPHQPEQKENKMIPANKQTPIPWEVYETEESVFIAVKEGGCTIAKMNPFDNTDDRVIDRVDAHLIVCAANNHHNLLATIKRMLDVLREQARGHSLGATTPERHAVALAAGEDVISQTRKQNEAETCIDTNHPACDRKH